MKYRDNKTNQIFDSLKDLRDSRLPKSPEDFELVPDLGPADYTELHELRIIPSDFCEDPREDFVFDWVTAHRRYNIGNYAFHNAEDCNEFLRSHAKDIEWSKKVGLYHPIFMYDHSEQTICLDENIYNDPWDSGKLGIVFGEPKKLRKVFRWQRISKKRLEVLKDQLNAEFKSLEAWVEGDCYTLFDDDEGVGVEFGTYEDCMNSFRNEFSKNGIIVEGGPDD